MRNVEEATREAGRANSLRVWQGTLLVFLVVLFACGAVHQRRFFNPTAASRLVLLHNLLSEGRWNIDNLHERTPDKALVGGRYYSDKPPFTVGVAFLGLYPFRGYFPRTGEWTQDDWIALSWTGSLISNVLPMAVGCAALFRALTALLGMRSAAVAVLGTALGGMPLVYSTLLFPHSGTFGLLAFALSLALPDSLAEDRRNRPLEGPRGAAIGLACGLAIASELTAALVSVTIAILALIRMPRSRLALCLGFVPGLVIIAAYNWIVTGSIATLPYVENASFPEMKSGVFGIKTPNPVVATALLFSLERGLFVSSPFLLAGALGYVMMPRDKHGIMLACAVVPVLQWIIISGRAFDWPAGNSYGPRYLVAALVLMSVPAAFAVARLPRATSTLFALSFIVNLWAVLTDPMSYGQPNPWADPMMNALVNGFLAVNVFSFSGIGVWQATILYLGIIAMLVGCILYVSARHDANTRVDRTGGQT